MMKTIRKRPKMVLPMIQMMKKTKIAKNNPRIRLAGIT
jgi:hypothetical protein